ncbi:hypothetical protein ACPXAU_24170, partial [Salmonella enterica]|uniref:hypothetical protein n=1 Tax=Salmonella enterica TaxID=28901 RepID=UPI003CF1B9F1
YAFEVTADPNGPGYDALTGEGAVAVEFVATSITSRGDPDSGGGLSSVLDGLRPTPSSCCGSAIRT